MIGKPYKVIVVVDPLFGDRLASLPPNTPVWVGDTPANNPVVHRLREERQQNNHLTGITTFRFTKEISSEDNLIREFASIDLHHGPASTNPPYAEIEVFGTSDSTRLRTELAAYGFTELLPTQDGFIAKRG